MTMLTVTLKWSDEYGHCYDCGLPAAFTRESAGVIQRDGVADESGKLCAVCAANAACDGEHITRLDDPDLGLCVSKDSNVDV